jgi:hypothetical protein
MKVISLSILCAINLTLFSGMKTKAQQPIEAMDYPFIIFLEGKPINWFEDPVPYIFIEFISRENIYGYIAHYRKTKGFDCFWKFKLTKYGDKYLSDSIPNCYEPNLKTSPISIVNNGENWSIYLPEDKRKFQLNVLPKDYSNKNRNYIYALSVFQVLYSKSQNKKGWHYELSNDKSTYFKYEQEPILNSDFNVMKQHIDSLDLNELANLLHIKDY